jgi:phosphate transport system permease protein
MSAHSFTGRGRRRQTRRGVRIAERIARLLISIGGVGTILAVTLILVFLVWVVVPLFLGAKNEARPLATLKTLATSKPWAVAVDEYQLMSWALFPDGRLSVWRNDDGTLLETRELVPGARITAISPPQQGDEFALGFADGTVRLARIGFSAQFVDPSTHPEIAAQLQAVTRATHEHSLVERTPEGQLRIQSLDVSVDAPIDLGLTSAIVALDRSTSSSATCVVALTDKGELEVSEISRRENMLTGEVTLDAQRHGVKWRARTNGALPAHVLISGGTDVVYLAWNDGILQRYDARDKDSIGLAEELDLVDGEGTLDALAFVIGKSTLVSGDSRGRLRGWFGIKPAGAKTRDGVNFVQAHELSAGGPAITSLSASSRSRVIAAGCADGTVELYHVTSHKLLFETRVEDSRAITGVSIAPKDDGLYALTAEHIAMWQTSLRHPEASLAALYSPVWYEGYEKPEHVWQSTGGTDDFEPKLGLVPLIFGTIKATFYSMLFGVPLALLAAVFTSEFLHPKLRTPLKSLTELMASLPSVVLGFMAAIIIAPLAQSIIPTILVAFVTIPFTLLLGGCLWQMLPPRAYIQYSGVPRFVAIFACLPLGVCAAIVLGPVVERALFAGDIQLWLSHARGNALGGWLLLLIPLAALIVLAFSTRVVGPWLRQKSATWNRGRAARFDLARFLVGGLATLLLALLMSWLLESAGADPRGGVLDTYVQRNALIVGFVMGFAIIPIIYTLAEDALSSVPGHLRLASLGAGATPWQTAVRVVIPTAMSGLFSAVMIGLGRAVGETMIVLMATGNTPVMSWNVFDGFRTLSANIAVELPEAVRDSTHYRTLFLAALCLFALTFVLNTLAEIVRQRFRKRAYQL